MRALRHNWVISSKVARAKLQGAKIMDTPHIKEKDIVDVGAHANSSRNSSCNSNTSSLQDDVNRATQALKQRLKVLIRDVVRVLN